MLSRSELTRTALLATCAIVALAGCAVRDYQAECDQSFAALEIGDSIGHARSTLACPDDWIGVRVFESASGRDEIWSLPGNASLTFEKGVLYSKSY
jgi:hypothetical protein